MYPFVRQHSCKANEHIFDYAASVSNPGPLPDTCCVCGRYVIDINGNVVKNKNYLLSINFEPQLNDNSN